MEDRNVKTAKTDKELKERIEWKRDSQMSRYFTTL